MTTSAPASAKAMPRRMTASGSSATVRPMMTKSGSERASTAASIRSRICSTDCISARRSARRPGPRLHLLGVAAVLDVQGGDARALVQLHRPEHVQRRLTRLVGVDDRRNGHFARDASGNLHHLGGGDHSPVRHAEICQRHHVAADVDRIESVGLGELAGDHGVSLRGHEEAGPLQEVAKPAALSTPERRRLGGLRAPASAGGAPVTPSAIAPPAVAAR